MRVRHDAIWRSRPPTWARAPTSSWPPTAAAVPGSERQASAAAVRSRPALSAGMRQVPAGLRRLVSRGELGYERRTSPATVTSSSAGPLADDTELFFFFPENGLRHDLALLRNILAAGVGDSRAAGGIRRGSARSADVASGRSRERCGSLAGGRAPRDAAPRGGPRRVRELGAVVQRDGRRARDQDRRPLCGPGPRAALHRGCRARAAHTVDGARRRGLAPRRAPRVDAARVAAAGRAARRRRRPSPAARRGPDGDLALGRRPGERSRRDRRARLADRGRRPCAWLGRTCVASRRRRSS